MNDASLALQTALRARLIGCAALMAIVPSSNILDHTGPAQRFPGIMIGEGQSANAEITLARNTTRATLDLHIWAKADDLASVKAIAGAIREAIRGETPWLIEDHHLVDLLIPMQRFMRDKQGETPLAHGVVQVMALLQEIWP